MYIDSYGRLKPSSAGNIMGWSSRQVGGFTMMMVGIIVMTVVGMVTMFFFMTMDSVPEGEPLMTIFPTATPTNTTVEGIVVN